MVFVIVYCLSFSLTNKPYSNKWYHYLIIVLSSICITSIRWLIVLEYRLEIVCDVILYIIVPFTINMTTSEKDRLLGKNLSNIILTLSIQIGLYFCYLGLGYWSGLLTSICFTHTITVPASTNFLMQFEKYIGIITFMLSMNMLIKRIKVMVRPIDIASDEAKEKELEEIKKGK